MTADEASDSGAAGLPGGVVGLDDVADTLFEAVEVLFFGVEFCGRALHELLPTAWRKASPCTERELEIRRRVEATFLSAPGKFYGVATTIGRKPPQQSSQDFHCADFKDL